MRAQGPDAPLLCLCKNGRCFCSILTIAILQRLIHLLLHLSSVFAILVYYVVLTLMHVQQWMSESRYSCSALAATTLPSRLVLLFLCTPFPPSCNPFQRNAYARAALPAMVDAPAQGVHQQTSSSGWCFLFLCRPFPCLV